MDPTSLVEAVPTQYGIEGWVVGVSILSIISFGGFMVWFFAGQYKRQQKMSQEVLERAFQEQAKDRDSHEKIIREVIQSHNHNQERIAEKIGDLANEVRALTRDRMPHGH